MKRNRFGTRIGGAVALWAAGTAGILLAEGDVHYLDVPAGEVAFTVVGQVTNTNLPIGPKKSSQYGYLSSISGLTDLFSASPQDETTAFFTFFTEARTTATRKDGPLTIIERTGTTAAYYNVAPHASFADPASFHGEAILIMDLTQQVIIDTTSSFFTVVNVNDVVSANSFEHEGTNYLLARAGDEFRTSLTGRLNTPGPPSGFFAGYVVAVAEAGRGVPRVIPSRQDAEPTPVLGIQEPERHLIAES